MASSALIVLLALAPSVLGQDACSKFTTFVKSQADIDAVSQCTVLDGFLGIDRDLRGPALIPRITSITGFVAGNPGASHSTPTLGPTYVESISFPDLVTVGSSSFRISGADYLTSLSLPKLKTIAGTLQVSYTKIDNLSFPSLESIDSVTYFTGAFNEISLPKLTKARSINIDATTGNLDCVALYAKLEKVTWTDPDQNSFPAFQCKSAKNVANSPTVPRSSTTSTSTSGASSTSASSTSTGTPMSPSASTTSSATGGGVPPSTTTLISTTHGPIHGNGTITRTTTTRGPTPTTSPTGLTTNGSNMLAAGVWSTIGSVAAIAVSVLMM